MSVTHVYTLLRWDADGMSNGSTFVSIHCWANNVCQFDLSLTVSTSSGKLNKDENFNSDKMCLVDKELVSEFLDVLDCFVHHSCSTAWEAIFISQFQFFLTTNTPPLLKKRRLSIELSSQYD